MISLMCSGVCDKDMLLSYIYNRILPHCWFSGELYPGVQGQHISGWLFCPEATETEPQDQFQFSEGEEDWPVDSLQLFSHRSVSTNADRRINKAWQSPYTDSTRLNRSGSRRATVGKWTSSTTQLQLSEVEVSETLQVRRVHKKQ